VERVGGIAAAPALNSGRADLVGTVAGLRAAEVERRSLTDAESEEIVRVEIAERQAAALGYERAGQREHAGRLRAEAEVLSAYLQDSPPR
jgi:uncharacterized protein